MQMSEKGIVALVADEGEVLRAYVCPAGVWTIGVGLTAASGVVRPTAGMTITKEQSRALLKQALSRNYEPRVRARGLTRSQHEFDGSTSFDFNTGRIHNANWVGHWLAGARAAAETSFKSWNKGGGRVLAGLTNRRKREWDMIAHGRYHGQAVSGQATGAAPARAPTLSAHADYKDALVKLGYDVGKSDAMLGKAVKDFQRDHKLTVDGIIGPATRAAFTRALEAKKATQQSAGTGAATGGGAAVASGDPSSVDAVLWAVGLGVTATLVVAGLWAAYRYRGRVFAWLPDSAKDWIEDKTGVVVGRRVAT